MSVFLDRRLDWRRILVFTHRWLGIAGGLLFVAWFISGIVMIYARMPELPAREVQERLPSLDLSTLRVLPIDASARFGQRVDRVRVSMLHGRPVYRLTGGRGSAVVFGDTGEPLASLGADGALSVVRQLVPEHAATIRYDILLTDADQWTLGVRGQMPVHRIALGDGDDSYLYVADGSGEAVMRTTASERRWAYAGAVVHWLYFTPFRRQSALWSQSIIWLSIAGCVLCLSGLVWGWSVARRPPYTGLMKWHHYAGLAFGAASLTWVFSGLLSMDPWAWSPGTAPTRSQRDLVAGGPLQLAPLTVERLRSSVLALGDVKEVEIRQFLGESYVAGNSRLVSVAHTDRGHFARFPEDALERAALLAMPGVPTEDAVWLGEYDSYYYSRDRRLPLPVLRVRYADANRTWLYLDPSRGVIARKEERLSRVNRWLYHGLHSLDFPFLYYRRPLWDVVVIALSIGGIVLSATTLLPAWRRLAGHIRRLRRLRR